MVETVLKERTIQDTDYRRFQSRVTTGKSLFLGDVDGRCQRARRYRDLMANVMADLGGSDMLSEFQRSLAKDFVALTIWTEELISQSAQGEAVDKDEYQRMVNSKRRLATTLGLKRQARDVTPTFESIQREYA